MLVAPYILIVFGVCSVYGIQLFPYGSTYGDRLMRKGGDRAERLDTSVEFPFFDEIFSVVFVQHAGTIAIGSSYPNFRTQSFPIIGAALIAPFWSDIHTENHNGNIWYRESIIQADLIRGTSMVKDAFPLLQQFNAEWSLIVTYLNVTFPPSRPNKPENTFQCVLLTDGYMTFTLFLYEQISWITKNLNDPAAFAQIGFNAGDGVRYFSVPGSRSAAIKNFASTSNVAVPGVWIFRIDGGKIESATCNNGNDTKINLAPNVGSVVGGTRIVVSGPCFLNVTGMTCVFGSLEVQATYINQKKVECISPPLVGFNAMKIPFTLVDNATNTTYQSIFTVRREEYFPAAVDLRESVTDNDTLELSWDRRQFQENATLALSFLHFKPKKFNSLSDAKHEQIIFAVFPNTGKINVPFKSLPFEFENTLDLSGIGVYTLHETSIPLLNDTENINQTQPYFLPLLPIVARILLPVVKKVVVSGVRFIASKALPKLSRLPLKTATKIIVRAGVKQLVKAGIKSLKKELWRQANKRMCSWWDELSNQERQDNIFKNLPTCPCNLRQAQAESRCGIVFENDRACNRNDRNSCKLHPGAIHCVRSIQANQYGAGQQCCYGRTGTLLRNNPAWQGSGKIPTGGGTVDLAHASFPYVGHLYKDVIPFFWCCVFSDSNEHCRKYIKNRPSTSCRGYEPSHRSCSVGFGDPHIVTLDDFEYTFNGIGEYNIVQCLRNEITVHGRAAQTEDADNKLVQATSWTAIVAKTLSSDAIEIFIDQNSARVTLLKNGIPQAQENGLIVEDYEDVSANFKQNDNSSFDVALKFGNGLRITLEVRNRVMDYFISLPEFCKRNTTGLLGFWDGNATNDLTDPLGNILPSNATEREIFKEFGEKWRITEEQSLFTYPAGRSYKHFQNLNFKPVFFDEISVTSEAKELCGEQSSCLFDFAMTNNKEVATRTKIMKEEVEEMVQVSNEEVIICQAPKAVKGAVYFSGNNTDYLPGTIVMYTCQNNSATIECSDSGNWTALDLSCDQKPKNKGTLDETRGNYNSPATLIIIGASAGGAMAIILLVAACILCKKRM